MIITKYKSKNGDNFELRESEGKLDKNKSPEGWYHNGSRLLNTVFLSSESVEIQVSSLKQKLITPDEFLEESDDSDKGYLYCLTTRDGKGDLKHTSELTRIVEDSGPIKLSKG